LRQITQVLSLCANSDDSLLTRTDCEQRRLHTPPHTCQWKPRRSKRPPAQLLPLTPYMMEKFVGAGTTDDCRAN